MIMTQGAGTIASYGSYTNNCTRRQLPYRIPVQLLQDVQLYIPIGPVKPVVITYELMYTCGPAGGDTVAITTDTYVIGQDTNENWYGVFKNLQGEIVAPSCFVIAITVDDTIYFSEEYCIEVECQPLILIEGCYGHLNNLISYDCEGVYFGKHNGPGTPIGDTSVVYSHKLFLRGVEVTQSVIKNSFKQGRTRNFRTEKEKLFQFWSELVPEWYISEIDAVFFRGEVFVDGVRYLVNETNFEKVEDCKRQWKPSATFKESCYQSFSCEAQPCEVPVTECCDPVIISTSITVVDEESGGSGGGGGVPPDIAPDTVVVEGVVGGTISVTGTAELVTGIAAGSNIVDSVAFANVRVIVFRGGLPLLSFDPGDGSMYYTKVLSSTSILLNTLLVNDEIIYIETIPE